jgi:hypothetical protein
MVMSAAGSLVVVFWGGRNGSGGKHEAGCDFAGPGGPVFPQCAAVPHTRALSCTVSVWLVQWLCAIDKQLHLEQVIVQCKARLGVRVPQKALWSLHPVLLAGGSA